VSALAEKYSIPVHMHQEEMFTIENTNPYVCKAYGLPLPELLPCWDYIPAKEGDTIRVGGLKFEVLETPGHSRGGLCFYERTEGILFSGDTLFAGAIGRTDHPGGDYDLLMKSIFEKLMILDGQVHVIPGHGPETDIATERNTNPFLMPFNEPYEE
jgi:glyoxylase-like metal-dependent hydrolase (beta-lactamase superfamily II)